MLRTAGLTLAALFAFGTAASAQIDDLGGTIAHIDTVANVITFTDGRIVHYDPLWRVIVNGREVAVTDIAPGAVVAVAPAGTTAARAVVPGAPQPAMAQVAPGAVAVPLPSGQRGVVAKIDETNHTITLQDGRVVNLREVQVWRQETLGGALRPGAEVYVMSPAPGTSVQATVPATGTTTVTTTAPAWTPDQRVARARVKRVDRSGSQIVLSDGRTIYVSPSAPVWTIEPKTVAVSEIRPGDQVVIQVQQIVPVAGVDAATTAPGLVHNVVTTPTYEFPLSSKVSGDRVVIVRYPETL